MGQSGFGRTSCSTSAPRSRLRSTRTRRANRREIAQLAELRVDLREGFDNDRVIVRIDGCEVLSGDAVSTDYAIGLAQQATFEVESGPICVEVTCPARGLAAQAEFESQDTSYLKVSLRDGRLVLEPAEDEPRYY